jgi:hypothetical protein
LLPPELVTLLAPLASALADAHDRALVHADVAAGNVVFGSDGRPMLGGFGVARAMHLGRRAAATAADDVFALASLAVASSDRLAGAPVALVQAVEAALVEDASARPDARALAQALLASCPAAPIRLAAPPGVEPHDGDAPPVRPAGRRRSAAAVLAACCLAAAVATGILWGRHDGTGATVLPVRPQSLASDPAATAAQPAWREIVARWETLRVRAFTTSQPRLLDAVYAPASKAGAEDRARLDVMKDRGLRVRGFGVTILGVNVVSSAARTAAVRVTDAFAAYELVDATGNVVGRGSARPARTFVMQVVRGPRGWRVAAVFAGRVQPTSARTAASMSS